MTSKELIRKSEFYLKDHCSEALPLNAKIFSAGALWMAGQLSVIDKSRETRVNANISFGWYGIMKYGMCMGAFVLSLWWLMQHHFLLAPFSVVVFYFFEVHFLFLFPLLIDDVKKPVLESISQTYKTGLLKTMLTVIPIGFYMIIGLFNRKSPYKNWYVGSLAIIIWYQHEIRNRI